MIAGYSGNSSIILALTYAKEGMALWKAVVEHMTGIAQEFADAA
jgi:hypothetical protein